MLPWLVAEIRRRGEGQAREVLLALVPPFVRCVPARSSSAAVFIFEHRAQFISRFVHNSNDLSYFAYLIRGQPENPESEVVCHVFRSQDPSQVPEVISSIRQVSKAALQEDSKPKQESDESFYNSQKFEVLYCGKVTVSHKKAPSTLVDDCIEKFRQHELERKRQRLLNGQRGSGETPVEFLLGDDPLSASLSESLELDSGVTEEGSESEAGDDSGPGLGMSSSISLGSLRGAFPECILEDSGMEEQQEVRMRCNSLAGSLQWRAREGSVLASTRRRHASAPNHVQPSDADKNRTMLFQVGRFEVNLISPDSKTVVLEKNFKDISSCSQGIKQTDHFGFICREPAESGPSPYVCYVFQCASESLVDEVMLTMKQAFSAAAALQSAKNQVKLCEACPMHDLHKLCERIEGLYPPRAKLAIQKYLSQLSDNEQADIFERVQRMKPTSDQEENELVILHLRQLCETKQKTHVHIGEAPQVRSVYTPLGAAGGGLSKLDVLKNKARTSLTNSLENIFSRGANRMRGRLGSMGSTSSFDRVSTYLPKPDESPGDSPPGTPPGFLDDDPNAPQFRRRAHTFSHPPVKKRISFTDLHAQTAKAPLRRQQSVAPDNGETRKRTLSGCSIDSVTAVSPSHTPRRVSWRQKIFLRVASPMIKTSGSMQQSDMDLLPLSPRALVQSRDSLSSLLCPENSLSGGGGRRGSSDYRALWKNAIHQQILLLRMEKENQRLEGIPKIRRGEVWLLLSQQHRLRHRLPSKQQPADTPYQDLLKQLTTQQHSILVDLGRTFPTHSYFSAQLGAGQLSLFNLLKAYSLLDAEVGYCQGISFVAGVLLLHMSEEQAFDTLKFLMYDLGFRRQYRPDMISLQIQMYQLSRLLHDYHRGLYNHLEEHEICPSLYAAPWFLTLYASQFPLAFVARIFDLLFVQGLEVIFKVALCLLASHEGEIVECDGFETIVDYLKTTIPTLTQAQMEQTIAKAAEMDISKQLHAYEVEYHVLQDEMVEAPPACEDTDRLEKLEKTNAQLKKQNMELLEKLQAARVKIQSLEANMENFLSRESKMKHMIRSLEQEKAGYQKTIERMRSCLPADAGADVEMTQIKTNGKAKAGSKKP
uniref:TBC1 domain family, member 4 n=1 Tax=Denticeps clupeoides TaxID=299321 RepID=A0AAY4EJ45_9TELE